MINLEDVRAAAKRVDGRIRRTPVAAAGPDRWFKLEYLQHAGSFKTRGMFNQILAGAERGDLPAAGVVAASGGNAGLAAAYAARELGVPAEVFVPVTAPAVKVAKLGKLGARVVQTGNEYAEAYTAALTRTQSMFCHAYDDADMVAGNGTIGLELLEQLPDVDTVLVAVGGGGLIAGVIAALRDRVNVVAVEPVTSCALHTALEKGEPVDVPVSGVAADSLGARRVGRIAFELAVDAKITSVLVTDDAIVEARRRLWDDYRIVVEHGTAAAQAALLSEAYVPQPGEKVAVLLCGANTNPSDLA
ncbi:putative threonine dehydratase [Actinoplanes missouriensis 431]|uniref:Putative threonine dehydratase n=1 Tax=Actinoplanes missouriensis (strain ATCC 14538 / DSM 43046 / CBS 188.64 / JCM 3121 / NBRC 102363 / NCIMB 12654 / NRRL B-3342 / UNCC 431) TaxID=512565 RepID=I0H0M1_ACTM4|nr:threonine/serine dehydratase [Actinoplanes missouriensis]BAL86558.1 putative threonine dehydratase [Actinoplanes missouriensis 431]